MTNHRISLAPTVARQTPASSFGSALNDAMKTAGQVSGSLLGAVPGGGIVSAAIDDVISLAGRGATSAVARASVTGVMTLSGGATTGGGSVSRLGSDSGGDVPLSLSGTLETMRQEADRSMVMQMNMQQESREYNALSNVLKVRHDSAKAAINNLR